MVISTLNREMSPNCSYRGVRSVQLLLLLLLLMVFSSENFGFSPPYAGIAGIGPVSSFPFIYSFLPCLFLFFFFLYSACSVSSPFLPSRQTGFLRSCFVASSTFPTSAMVTCLEICKANLSLTLFCQDCKRVH